MLPSPPMAYVEIVPSPKLVTNTVRPSLLIAAQHTSLRVLPTGPREWSELRRPTEPVRGRGLAGLRARRFGHDQDAIPCQVEAVGRRPDDWYVTCCCARPSLSTENA